MNYHKDLGKSVSIDMQVIEKEATKKEEVLAFLSLIFYTLLAPTITYFLWETFSNFHVEYFYFMKQYFIWGLILYTILHIRISFNKEKKGGTE